MKIIRAKDYNDLSRKAANIISAQVILKPESVLGLATGSSPLGIYRQLILWYEKGDLDFAETTTVNLDEYRGLRADNEQSYHYFMRENLFGHVDHRALHQRCRHLGQLHADRSVFHPRFHHSAILT